MPINADQRHVALSFPPCASIDSMCRLALASIAAWAGHRLAELQLKILWEEILKRFPMIEVVERPTRIYSNFIHGFSSMPVRIPA